MPELVSAMPNGPNQRLTKLEAFAMFPSETLPEVLKLEPVVAFLGAFN